MTIAGSILAGICLVISAFAQNVLTLIFTVGIGTGFGFGLIYLPAIVSVTTYFEKYRSLATGIAVCGSGLGTFIFSPLTEYLIGEYGWRGATLILAGVVFNCIIFGAMFRPLEPPRTKKKRSRLHYTDEQIPLNDLQGAAAVGDNVTKSNSHGNISMPTTKAAMNNNNNSMGGQSDTRRSDNFLSVDKYNPYHSAMPRSVSIGQDMTTNYNVSGRFWSYLIFCFKFC